MTAEISVSHHWHPVLRNMDPWMRNSILMAFNTCVLIVLYCLLGGVVYVNSEPDWSIVDAIYFCIVTMSTVGYGDLSPSTKGTKLFTIFMIFIGILVVFSQVAALINRIAS